MRTERESSSSTLRSRDFKKWFLGILIVAVVLRIASAIYQGNAVTDLPGTHDQLSYDGLARRVVQGHGFSFGENHWPATPAGQPTAHWSYLYTLYLAAVYAAFGPNPLIARLVQSIAAGILHTWLAWRIGRRLFGWQSGLIAAALSATYIYFFYYAGALMTEAFYFLGILWTFDVAFRIVDRDQQQTSSETRQGLWWLIWVELGLAIGITVLLRQVFLVFVPFLYLWLWLWWDTPCLTQARKGSVLQRLLRAQALQGLVVSSLMVLILILPWTVRNYRAFGTFSLLNTNAGFAFYWGNHPIHDTHFIPLLPVDGPSYGDLIPKNLRSLNEAKLDRALLKEALEIITADPARYLLLSLTRPVEYFKFWPSEQSSLISNVSRVTAFGLILPFLVHGLCVSATLVRRPEPSAQRAQILLLYSFMFVYTLVHLLTWTLIRYRLPVDAIMILFAAKSLAMITSTVRRAMRVVELW
jgi:hypothetical protein